MAITTKRALAESFKKLLSKRALDKITVKDIVEDCGVNRQTFYYHFHDIYDLMEWVFRDAADTLMRERMDYNDWTTGVDTLMEYLRQERFLVLNVYHSVSHEVVADYLKKLLRPYILQVVQVQAAGLETPAPQEDVDFVTDIFTLTVAGIIMEWIGRQMKMQGTEERLRKLYAAMNGSIRFMLRNLGESGSPGGTPRG